MPAAKTDIATPARWADWIAVAVLVLVAMVALLTFENYGLGWDDFAHSQYGDLLLSYYSSEFRDTRALNFVNLFWYGGGFDMAAALLAKVLPFDLFETRRLFGAMVGLTGLAATWRFGRSVGGPVTGLVALILLAACPMYYGHMFINPKDAPFAAATALYLLGVVRALEQYPQPSPGTSLILGLGFGLAIGSRILAGFGVIAALLALLLLLTLETRARSFREAAWRAGYFLLALVPSLLIAYAVMAVVWPWAAVDPLNPLRAVRYFSHFFEKPWQELFDGVLLAPTEMPRRYLPTLLALKLPEIFLLLTGLGTIGTIIAVFRSGATPRRSAVFLAVLLAAWLPVAATVTMQPAMYNGIRHFLFLLPPLAVLGGLTAGWLAYRLRRYGRLEFIVGAAVLLGTIELPVIEMVWLHPYEYAYFNQIAGGPRKAQASYMLDYWGLAFKQAGRDLRLTLVDRGIIQPASRKWKIAVCGPHPPAAVALGDQFELTWDPRGADFALMLGTFYCAQFDVPRLVEINRDGVVFARVYDLRGVTVPSLFTVPPVERK